MASIVNWPGEIRRKEEDWEREREREKELEGEKERAREEGRFAHPKLPSDKATKPHCTFLLRQLGLSDKDVAAFEGRRNKK
jgi:hypothetical protein